MSICLISCYRGKVCICSFWKIWSYTMSTIVLIKNSFTSFIFVGKIFNKESRWPSGQWRSLWFSRVFYISSFHESNCSTRPSRITIGTIDWMSVICPSNYGWVLSGEFFLLGIDIDLKISISEKNITICINRIV